MVIYLAVCSNACGALRHQTHRPVPRSLLVNRRAFSGAAGVGRFLSHVPCPMVIFEMGMLTKEPPHLHTTLLLRLLFFVEGALLPGGL